MRILQISALPVWPIAGKGGMPSLRETLRGHVRGGHEITLIVPRYDLFADRLVELTTPADAGFDVYYAGCSWMPAMKALRRVARAMGKGGELPYALRWVLNLTTWCLLTASLTAVALKLRYRRRRRFDLVYAHNQYAAIAGWIMGKALGVPNVTRLYGTFLADLIRLPLVSLRYPVAAGGFRVPSSLIICGNDGTRGDEVAKRMGIDPRRFRFWQNGVDLPSARPTEDRQEMSSRAPTNLRTDSKWIFTCSRLSYWKRIDRIIKGLAVARASGCDAQLIIAGDGAEQAALQSLAGRLGVAEEVVWLGGVAHDDIWSWMHVADVFVIANDVTNRCNPLYEAICAALPIVSVRDPSTADLLGDGENARLIERDDTEALGVAMAELCADGELARRMRENQKARAAGLWSWRQRLDVELVELDRLVEKA